jgi:hypothetical protein
MTTEIFSPYFVLGETYMSTGHKLGRGTYADVRKAALFCAENTRNAF